VKTNPSKKPDYTCYSSSSSSEEPDEDYALADEHHDDGDDEEDEDEDSSSKDMSEDITLQGQKLADSSGEQDKEEERTFDEDEGQDQDQDEDQDTLIEQLAESDTEIMYLRRKVARLENKVSALQAVQSTEALPYRTNTTPIANTPKTLITSIQTGIDNAVQSTRLRKIDKIDGIIADAVWSDDFRGGGVKEALMDRARDWIRKEVFPPWKVLKAMDASGGKMNYEGLELLRCVETQHQRYFRKSLLPCTADCKRVAAIVEYAANTMFPLVQSTTASGAECITLDPKMVLLYLLDVFGILEMASERSVDVGLAIDAANLSKYLHHTTTGIKVTDYAARDPNTGLPLLSAELKGDGLRAQSSSLCFPIMMIMEGETHESLKEFQDIYTFFDRLTIKDQQEIPDIQPVRLTTEGDMSVGWKGLKRGGAAKVHTNPCHCCAVRSENLARPNAIKCSRWCTPFLLEDVVDTAATRDEDAEETAEEVAATKDELLCFHHDLVDECRLREVGEQIESLEEALAAQLSEIDNKTKINRDSNVSVLEHSGEAKNPRSIHFEPETTSERQQYSKFINDELKIRDLSRDGGLLVRRERLRAALVDEIELKRLIETFAHCSPKEGALFQLLRCIPCVLHMENRIGLKMVYMCLVEGLSNCKEKVIFCAIEAEGTRIKAFLAALNTVVNTEIIGTLDVPGQWKCPYIEKENEIGDIKFGNVKTRRFIDRLERILSICIPATDCARLQLWHNAVANYRHAMGIARQKEDYTDADILTFQQLSDQFFNSWVQLHGLSGCTNYIHMVSSGHVADYMHRCRNLYRHSQQGWEQMNDVIKTFFYRRTSRGGATNKGKGLRKRLFPIGRWFQRRLVWLKVETFHEYTRLKEDWEDEHRVSSSLDESYSYASTEEEEETDEDAQYDEDA